MKTLFIDTTSNKEIIVRLTVDEKSFEEKKEIQNNRTQVVLPTVEQLLKDNKITPRDLDRIEVNSGPGSFTGVRIGVSIANALAFSLQIPVNNIIFTKDKSVVEPVY